MGRQQGTAGGVAGTESWAAGGDGQPARPRRDSAEAQVVAAGAMVGLGGDGRWEGRVKEGQPVVLVFGAVHAQRTHRDLPPPRGKAQPHRRRARDLLGAGAGPAWRGSAA